jgi:hypothetical protein
VSEHRAGYKLGGVTGKGFMPGRSGNPGGRPKGESITSTLRRLVAESEHNGRPIQEVLAEVLLKHALSGKFPFAKEILDRLDGPLNQRRPEEGNNAVRIIVEDVRGNQREGTGDDIRELMAPSGDRVVGHEREVGSLREFYANYPAPLPPGFAPPSTTANDSLPGTTHDTRGSH